MVLTAGCLGIAAAYGRYRFGSISASFAYIRGERLLVANPVQSIDKVRAGESVIVRYAVTNLTGHPVRLIGKTASCSCTAIEDLPSRLATSETRQISATITFPEDQVVGVR